MVEWVLTVHGCVRLQTHGEGVSSRWCPVSIVEEKAILKRYGARVVSE